VLEQEEDVTRARLALARSAQIVLRNGMTVLGITSPERM
jgi:arginyl-tRNA synthetase